jgi:hypothetical protein
MKTMIRPTMLETVYAALADNPMSTTRELSAVCDLGHHRVSQMVHELVAQGRAVACVKRDCRVTHRWMTPWRVLR